MLDYHQFTNRNIGLINESEQEKIKNTSILLAGCGVGSGIAECAIRTGFTKFVLMDGDTVDLSNLNRQIYYFDQVGQNKAEALKENLIKINPEADIQVIPEFLDPNKYLDQLKPTDIIIDAIDPEAPLAIIALHKYARMKNISVIIPLDVGFGARAIVLNENSYSYEQLIDVDHKENIFDYDQEVIMSSFIKYFLSISPVHVQEIVQDILTGKQEKYPQPSIAANTLAGLVGYLLVQISLNQTVKVAPEYYGFDQG